MNSKNQSQKSRTAALSRASLINRDTTIKHKKGCPAAGGSHSSFQPITKSSRYVFHTFYKNYCACVAMHPYHFYISGFRSPKGRGSKQKRYRLPISQGKPLKKRPFGHRLLVLTMASQRQKIEAGNNVHIVQNSLPQKATRIIRLF